MDFVTDSALRCGFVDPKLAAVVGCGKIVIAKACPKCGYVEYVPLLCHKRTCPTCAKVRREKFIVQYHDWVMRFKWPVFMTLTLARQEDLSEGVKRIVTDFHKLRRQKWWKVRTGFWCLEVVEKQDGWHIHIHCLADAVWIDQHKLSESWRRLTGDSYIVDVRRVKRDQKREAIFELFKYITKLWELTDSGKKEIEQVLKHKRFVNWFGQKPKKKKIPKVDSWICPDCGADLILAEISVSGKIAFSNWPDERPP